MFSESCHINSFRSGSSFSLHESILPCILEKCLKLIQECVYYWELLLKPSYIKVSARSPLICFTSGGGVAVNMTCHFIEQSFEDPWKCTVNLDLNMGFLGILVKKGECFISYYELYLCWFMQNYSQVQLCCVQNWWLIWIIFKSSKG